MRSTGIIRLSWIIAALFALFLMATAVPYRYAMLASGRSGYSPAAQDLGLSLPLLAFAITILEAATWLSFIVVAWIIAWFKSNHWFPFVIALTLTFLGVMPPLVDGLMTVNPAWQTLIPLLRALVYSGMLAMLCLFPDGRFVPSWSRWYLFAWFLFTLIFWPYISTVLSDMSMIPDTPTLPNGLVLLVIGVLATIGLLFQFIRYRTYASAEQRQQTKWYLYGMLLLTASSLLNGLSLLLFPALRDTAYGRFLYTLGMETLLMLAGIGFSVAIAFAILRYRLWDIDVLINRTLVYGGLTAITMAFYVFIVGRAGIFFQSQVRGIVAFLATGAVAILFQPLRVRLQTAVDRLMYGQRDDPVGMLAQLAHRLETVDRPERILPTLVETIATALKLPYAALWLPESDAQWQPVAVYGRAVDEQRLIPLLHQNREIGRLFVCPRGPGERFSREDERLLAAIAQLAATTVQAARLSLELQQSRRQIVTSREEERRRLRRDLHDGLGPVLAAVALQADTARDLADSDPAETKAILDSIMQQAQTAVADVRRLVYNLRPPALDELGLVGALRQSVQAVQGKVAVTIDAPDPLPPLPAAVEVAAYRIAQEAVNNVVKHAGAQSCAITIRIHDGLQLVVEDDGKGVGETAVSGVGLLSMQERAAELGGSCVIESLPGGGTRVTAVLPLPKGETDETG